jgi:hypothetical protein
MSNQIQFIFSHVSVLTTVLTIAKSVPFHRNGDSWTNVSQLNTLKHTPCLYPRHKRDQPIPLLSRGLGPYPSLDSKPSTPEDPVSVWCLDLHLIPTPKNRSRKSRNHDKRVTSLFAPINKYMLRIISLWPDYHPLQRTVLNWHRRNKCNQSLAR